MYHIALCDDNKEFLEEMGRIVESNLEYDSNMVCSSFSSGVELLDSDVSEFDLLIIDMQMDKVDGFSTAKQVRRKNKDIVIGFCSGVVMPLPEHFEVQPYRYMIKRNDTTEIQKTVTELLAEMKRRKKKKIVEVVSDGKAYRINIKDILYVYRQNRGSILVIENNDMQISENGSYVSLESNEKLVDWYQQLSDYGFEFPHTSYIVNMQKIKSIIKDDICMSDGQLLRITRTYKQKFHERFSYYFSKKYRRTTDK